MVKCTNKLVKKVNELQKRQLFHPEKALVSTNVKRILKRIIFSKWILETLEWSNLTNAFLWIMQDFFYNIAMLYLCSLIVLVFDVLRFSTDFHV